jgi:predicted Zn-dependent peptidase
MLGGEKRVRVEQEISLPRLYVGYRTPAYGTDEYYTSAVVAQILGYGKAALLYRSLIREQRLAQDVETYAFPIVVGASMLVLWATALPGVALERLESALHEQIDALQHVEARDVTRAVRLMEARQLSDLQTVGERADQLSMYTTLFDDPARINTEVERVRAVTVDHVRSFAARFLNDRNRVVMHYIPKTGNGA